MNVTPSPDSDDPFLMDRPTAPYPGLRRFRANEWPIFFGRERMVDETIERLYVNQAVLVHGGSGSGKSSLIFAGVLPKLAQSYRGTQFTWRTCSFRPGDQPIVRLANALEAEQRSYNHTKGKDDPAHYFRMMKELAILGYFTSEIGCTQAVKYVEVPGAYHGDVPYKKGDRAWF